MSDGDSERPGPDASQGIALSDLQENEPMNAHVGDRDILLVRQGDVVYATGASCPHKGAALADGLVTGNEVRCPFHHACFDLKTGAASAPSLDPIPCWRVDIDGGRAFVRDSAPMAVSAKPADQLAAQQATGAGMPESVVVVGAGGAGQAAAQTLRSSGYEGPITLVSASKALPIDRTLLSKGFLSGDASLDSLKLRERSFFDENDIGLRLGSPVTAIDRDERRLSLADGDSLSYGKLLFATGARAVEPPIEGIDLPNVHLLHTLEEAQALTEHLKRPVDHAVVIGASFIGLETAAALRARDVKVTVVAPDAVPLAKILGEELGRHIQQLHTEQGVMFQLESKITRIEADGILLEDGSRLAADLVVSGTGVSPETSLAEAAGLDVDDGIKVNHCLQTSDPDIYAAGDVARWPERYTGESQRIEHWFLAQRHGAAAARNMLGAAEPFADVPFFWSKHYSVNLRYSGHASDWDSIQTDGDLAAGNYSARFIKNGKAQAIATIGRDRECLEFAAELERTV